MFGYFYSFQIGPILHAGEIPSTRTLCATCTDMENAYIHIGTSIGVGDTMVNQVIANFIDISICINNDGAASTALSIALQFTRDQCGNFIHHNQALTSDREQK